MISVKLAQSLEKFFPLFKTELDYYSASVTMASNDEDDHKFIDKMKNNPTVPLGLAGLIGIVVYGVYNFKNKTIKPSLYLIQLRVAAQGTLVACMSLGVLFTFCKANLSKLFPDSEKKN